MEVGDGGEGVQGAHGCVGGNREGWHGKMREKGYQRANVKGSLGRGGTAVWKGRVQRIRRVGEGSGASSSPWPRG